MRVAAAGRHSSLRIQVWLENTPLVSEDGHVVVEAHCVVNMRSYHEDVSAKCSCKELAASPWVGVKQVLLNPLSNACKFTNEGEVALRERKVADGRDCGPTCIGADVQLGRTFLLRA